MKTARKHPATSAFLAAPLRLLLLAALLAGGCEDDDDGGGGGGGDFGDRDPTHCAVAGDSIAVGYGDAGTPWPARLAAKLERNVANHAVAGLTSGGARAILGGVLAAGIIVSVLVALLGAGAEIIFLKSF